MAPPNRASRFAHKPGVARGRRQQGAHIRQPAHYNGIDGRPNPRAAKRAIVYERMKIATGGTIPEQISRLLIEQSNPQGDLDCAAHMGGVCAK